MNLLTSINNPIKSNLKPLIYVDISYSDPSGNTFTNTDNSFKTNLLFQNTCTLTINNPTNNDLTIYYYIIGKGETGATAVFQTSPTVVANSGRGGRGGRILFGNFICPSGNNLYNITINNANYTGLNGGGIVTIINSNTNITNSASNSFFRGGVAVTSDNTIGLDGSNNTTIVFPDGKYYGGGGGSGGKVKSNSNITIYGGSGGDYGGGNGGIAKSQGAIAIQGDGFAASQFGGGGGGGAHSANGNNSSRIMGVGGVGGNGAVFIYFKERHKII